MSKQTLEEKQAEKGRLWKRYLAVKRLQWAAMVKQEPRLGEYAKRIRGKSPREIFASIQEDWIAQAEDHYKYVVLQIIDKEANRQKRLAGGEALDDPLPPERNLYIACREYFALR